MTEFEILAEWRIRKIRPLDELKKEEYLTWVLTSLGLTEEEQKAYRFLLEKKLATVDDLSKALNIEVECAEEILGRLHTLGLVEKVGRAYYIEYSLGEAIIRRTLPRIVNTLKEVAKIESSARLCLAVKFLRGRAFSSVREALPYIKYLLSKGFVKVAVTGVHVFAGRTVELEGLVEALNYENKSMRILYTDGREVEVGDQDSKGIDVRAVSILVEEGEESE